MKPCPICRISIRSMPFHQYRLICPVCWAGLRNFETTQLQYRLMFQAAIQTRKAMSTGA